MAMLRVSTQQLAGKQAKKTLTLDEKIWCKDLMRRSVFDDESQDMLSTITKMIEDLQLKNRKQSSIKAYFNKSL